MPPTLKFEGGGREGGGGQLPPCLPCSIASDTCGVLPNIYFRLLLKYTACQLLRWRTLVLSIHLIKTTILMVPSILKFFFLCFDPETISITK